MIDTRIPLMAQGPDVLNALAVGTQNAANQAALMRQAEGQNLFRQYGAGAIQGDTNALNALAGFDPGMAQGLELNRRQDMRADETLRLAQAAGARAAQEAQDRAAAMAEAQQAQGLMRQLAQAYATGNEAAFGAISAEIAGQPLPMEPRSLQTLDAFISGFSGGLSSLAPAQPEEPESVTALRIRATEAGLQPGTPEYAQFMAQGGRNNGIVFESTPDGGVRMAQGDAATSFRFTEAQSKDNVYATRAEGSLALLDSVGADALADRTSIIADSVPLGLARGLQPEEFQVAQQAGNEFLQAILRKDTGAAITADEQALYGVTYLPQPGDGPQVLEAKRQARIRAIEALKSGMNIQQLTVQERALVRAAERAGVEPPQTANRGGQSGRNAAPSADFSGASMEDLMGVDLLTLPADQLDAWERRLNELQGQQ